MEGYFRKRSADTLIGAGFLVPRKSSCYPGFALDFPGNQLLHDACEQSKEKGLDYFFHVSSQV